MASLYLRQPSRVPVLRGQFLVSEQTSSSAGLVSKEDAIVLVLDDDPLLRESLISLLRSIQLQVEAFGSPQELLQSPFCSNPDTRVPACLVSDIRLPGLSGLDLQAELAKANITVPIIFITGHGDIPMTVRAMKAGAVDFLTKPFRDQDLLDAIQQALKRDQLARRQQSEIAELHERHKSLTAREREVMELMVSGMQTKQIATAIGTSEVTAAVHRGNVMRKMHASSPAELGSMVERLKLSSNR